MVPAVRRELFPNAYVDIAIAVLERDGSVLSTCINAASVALVEAGIEMLDIPLACSALLAPSRDTFLMDPSLAELEAKDSSMSATKQDVTQFTMVFLPRLNQLSQLHLTGACSAELLNEALVLGTDGVRAIHEEIIRPVLLQ